MSHRSRNPFVELLISPISPDASNSQQLTSDGHKGSAVVYLSIYDSQPCVLVSNVLEGGVIVQYDECQLRQPLSGSPPWTKEVRALCDNLYANDAESHKYEP
jgi:hypothetical protein